MSTTQASSRFAWPATRSRRSTVEAQFGETRANLIQSALTTGDPLADDVISEIHEHGREVRVALNNGIAHGLDSLTDPPPAVAALLKHVEATPDYADDALLDDGCLPYFTKPVTVTGISLSAGALVRSYQSPSISTVLAMTGRLVEGAPRRLYETGLWLSAAMLPGSMRRGEHGWISTLQVRILHAAMRRLALNRGYDELALGTPINQVDMARTWMDFTLTSLKAEEKMGFDITSAEQDAFYRYWWYVGHVMGVEPLLVEGITNNEEAQRVDDLLQTVTGPLIPEATVLTEATLASLGDRLHTVLKLPTPVTLAVMRSLTRRIHGTTLSQELSIPTTRLTDRAMSAAVPVIKSRRARLRTNPEGWQAAMLKNIEVSRSRIATQEGRTGYQHHTGE